MIDIYATILRLQTEREEQMKVPTHIEFARLMNEVSKEVRKELNALYQEGKVGACETINGKAVFVKENNKEYGNA